MQVTVTIIIIMDPVSFERRSLLSSSPIKNGQQKKRRILKCFRNYWKEIKARSLNIPSILLLVYSSSIPVCKVVLSDIANDITNSSGSKSDESWSAYGLRNALYLLIPFCGWLSDAKISHGRAIYLSLWLGWIATLLCSIGYCLQYSSYGIIALIGKYALSSVALIFLVPSMAFMFTNILPYGIDQMMNVSSVKIRAFIHWFVWVYFFCTNVSGYSTHILVAEYQTGALIIAVAGFVLFSFSLCLHFHLQHRFEHIPIPNPYKIVFKVLKYSIQNNHNRRQRSAFTYWGKEPSRIDLAKERYGGSFTHEEAENVKTLLRMVAILVSLIPFIIVFHPIFGGMSNFFLQFKDSDNAMKEKVVFFIQIIGYSGLFVLIPLLELVILPLFPKLEYFLINPLRGLGLANILIILSILSVFLIDLIGRAPYDKIHDEQANCNQTIQVSYWILVIPSLLSATSYFIAFLCIFEFLCSQTPFGMHAMIIGFFWLVRSVGIDIGLGIMSLYRYFTFSLSILSCTSWYTIMLCLVGLVGLVVYVLTARWYVKRIRDTDLDLRNEIEQRWEQRLIRNNRTNDSQTDYIISSAEMN